MRMHYVRSLLLAIAMLFVSTAAFAQVSVSVTIAPPELPVYDQPLCPGEGYIWTPGYWAWDGEDYYWVPGTWVLAPEVGFLCGLRRIGPGAVLLSFSMTAIGDPWWVSMAELTMGSATSDTVS